MTKEPDFTTRCVHGGLHTDPYGAPHTPIYNTSTFTFDTTADLVDVLEGRREGGLYTRFGMNPTVLSLERQLAELEGAEAALVFTAGMAAESALFLAHGRKGIVCLGDAYGGTLELLDSQLPLLQIPTRCLLGRELEQLTEALTKGYGLLFFETPTNPTLEMFDIHALAELAHRHGALLVVDNTFASPVNQQPLGLGADLVLHSATKYLGGHSDLTAGALMGPKALLDPVWAWRKNLGQAPAPETAALLARSLRTLPLRVQRQSDTALAVAKALEAHPRVARVLYPGLTAFQGYRIARKQMRRYGGMLSFELDGSGEEATSVVDRLKLFGNAASLGGVESLATQPAISTHRCVPEEDRIRRGIGGNLIRLSVGLEDAEDLIADLTQALDRPVEP
jgi:cystathionine beta-lyase/cystathionine gamma-synthase